MARFKPRPEVELFARLAAIGRLADRRLERTAPAGLSLAGLTALSQLAERPEPPSPNDLARALWLSKGAITNTLQRLEAEGLVALAADADDGRRKRIALTAAGVAAQRAALAEARPKLAALRGAFDAGEFEAALPFLRRLQAWLEANP